MRPPLRLACCCAAALALSCLAYRLAPEAETGVWKGCRILLVEEDIPEARVLETLAQRGIREVISESSQPIEISDFKGIVSVELPRARARLVAGDPRRDSYIEGLGSWFKTSLSGKGYRIYYLRTGQSGISAKRKAAILSSLGGDAFFPEASSASSPSVLGLCLYLAACAALVFFSASRKEGFLSASAMLPGLALCLKGNEPLALCLWASVSISFLAPGAGKALAEYGLSRRIGRCLSLVLASLREAIFPLLSLALGLAFLPSLIPAFGLALFASCACLLTAWQAMELLPGRGKGPETFLPVPILGKKAGHAWGSSRRRGWLGSGLCLLSLALLWIGPSRPAPGGSAGATVGAESILLPQPRPLAGEAVRPSPQAALRLQASHGKDDLPDLSDWLVHRWREEALFYLPLDREEEEKPFAELSIPASETSREISRSFGPAWAAASYRSMSRGGVESLLSSGRSFLRVELLPYDPKKSEPLAPIEPLLYIILLAPSLAGIISLLKDGTKIRRGHGKAA